ncbi:MAG: ABC transporter permease [Clostridia bacterium]|nr:ABC transporter permease [Clostridia bacterium]
MKNTAFVVFKKELTRFFGDKRLLFTTVLLPGLIIFVMYSVMGQAMTSSFSTTDSTFNIAVVNMPSTVKDSFKSNRYNITNLKTDDIDSVREKISNKSYQLCLVFPEDFDEILLNYSAAKSEDNIPNVEIYYNSSDIQSSNAYGEVVGILGDIEEEVSNVFDINHLDSDEENTYDVATDEEASGMLFAMILPMILMTMMYTSCVSFAVESIAGEKERGTIASLLITPTPRNQIILGKVLALSVMALLSGLSSFIGTMLSMPMLVGTMEDAVGGISAEYYVFSDYLWLVLIILSTIILFVTLISVLSTLAKTVKEASSLVMPLMIVVMLVSFGSMYGTEAKSEIYWYMIPVYNSVQSMVGIFSFDSSPINMGVTLLVNLLLSSVGLFALTKMFNNENIMFGK